jgi:AAA ATPase containing von Willebrand factor type A (vWA) domain
VSARGKEIQTPLVPRKPGRTSTRGMSRSTCRDRGEKEGWPRLSQSLEHGRPRDLEADEEEGHGDEAHRPDSFGDEGLVAGEQPEDLPGKDLRGGEADEGEGGGCCHREANDPAGPVKVSRSVVVAQDGLETLGYAHEGHEEKGKGPVDDPVDGHVKIPAPVDEGPVDEDDGEAARSHADELRRPHRHDFPKQPCRRDKVLPAERKGAFSLVKIAEKSTGTSPSGRAPWPRRLPAYPSRSRK